MEHSIGITATGNHGTVTFNLLGTVLSMDHHPFTKKEERYDYITRFNVSEYMHTYGELVLNHDVDICDIGYWYNMGDRNGYEPPSEDFRKEQQHAQV